MAEANCWTGIAAAPGLQVYRGRTPRYRVRLTTDGVRRTVPIVAESDVEATAKAWALHARAEAGVAVAGRTVLDVLPEYLAAATIAPTTKELYRNRIARFAGSLDTRPIAELEVADVRRWLRELGELRKPNGEPYTPNSIHGVRTAVAALFRWAARNGELERNPFAELDADDAIPRARPAMPRTITIEQADALADATGDRTARALIRFAVRSGLRSGELRALRWEHVDIPGRAYTLSQQVDVAGEITPRLKTSRSGRRTPLLTPARDELISWREESGRTEGLVFANEYGHPIHRDRLRWLLERGAKAIGIEPLGPHVFRHSFVAALRAAGTAQADLALLARDAEPTLARYYDGNHGVGERIDELAMEALA